MHKINDLAVNPDLEKNIGLCYYKGGLAKIIYNNEEQKIKFKTENPKINGIMKIANFKKIYTENKSPEKIDAALAKFGLHDLHFNNCGLLFLNTILSKKCDAPQKDEHIYEALENLNINLIPPTRLQNHTKIENPKILIGTFIYQSYHNGTLLYDKSQNNIFFTVKNKPIGQISLQSFYTDIHVPYMTNRCQNIQDNLQTKYSIQGLSLNAVGQNILNSAKTPTTAVHFKSSNN